MAKGVLQHQKQISKKGDITTVAQTEQMLIIIYKHYRKKSLCQS